MDYYKDYDQDVIVAFDEIERFKDPDILNAFLRRVELYRLKEQIETELLEVNAILGANMYAAGVKSVQVGDHIVTYVQAGTAHRLDNKLFKRYLLKLGVPSDTVAQATKEATVESTRAGSVRVRKVDAQEDEE